MCRVLPFAPFNLVDLLFDLQTFQIIKLGFMRLKLGMEFVLATLFLVYMSA